LASSLRIPSAFDAIAKAIMEYLLNILYKRYFGSNWAKKRLDK